MKNQVKLRNSAVPRTLFWPSRLPWCRDRRGWVLTWSPRPPLLSGCSWTWRCSPRWRWSGPCRCFCGSFRWVANYNLYSGIPTLFAQSPRWRGSRAHCRLCTARPASLCCLWYKKIRIFVHVLSQLRSISTSKLKINVQKYLVLCCSLLFGRSFTEEKQIYFICCL